jgi:hypothetical protein
MERAELVSAELYERKDKGGTLFGRYETIDAVKTMAPLMLSFMNALDATLAR